MSVSAEKPVYDFRRKYNSVNSGRNQDIALVDIIAYLNEAQEIWFENRVFVAQTNQRVRNDLRAFKVDALDLEVKDYSKGSSIAIFPSDLYHRLDQLVIASKADCCKGITKEIIPRIIQSDDLHEARHNPLRKSDFFFEQLLAVEGRDGLILYHDNAMKIESACVDYYRKPKEMHAPKLAECQDGKYYYNYCGEIITENQDFESSDTFALNAITDIAVLRASRDVSDPQGFQSQLNAILSSLDLHK